MLRTLLTITVWYAGIGNKARMNNYAFSPYALFRAPSMRFWFNLNMYYGFCPQCLFLLFTKVEIQTPYSLALFFCICLFLSTSNISEGTTIFPYKFLVLSVPVAKYTESNRQRIPVNQIQVRQCEHYEIFTVCFRSPQYRVFR